MNPHESGRILWLDAVRTLAIISVVFCHSVESVYDMSLSGWQNLHEISKIFRALGFTVGRLGVPLFFFLTGSLVLSKALENDDDCVKFYRKNLLPLFLCTEIWIVLYNLFNAFVIGGNFNIKVLFGNMLFLKDTNMMNMWYMPTILGIYLAIPFLAIVLRHFSLRILIWPIIISLVANFMIPSINIVLDLFHKGMFNIVLNLMFLGGEYGFYVFIGYFLYKKRTVLTTVKIFIYFIISLFATSMFQFWVLESGYAYNLWYDFIGILFTAIFLFELLRRFDNSPLYNILQPILTLISKISLGIFFVHMPIMILTKYFIKSSILPQPLKVITLFILTFCFCIITILVLRSNRFIKKVCFLIK